MKKLFLSKSKERGGMTLEYILLSAFTAIASMTAIGVMRTAMQKQLNQMSEQLDRSFDAGEQ